MMVPPHPNFFLLLELNPDESWDDALYERVLQEKIRQWSRESTGIAKKALPAQANRALLPQIRRVMESPSLREMEAEEARKLLVTRYQRERQVFEKQLMLLNMKEAVEPEEIERFVKDFKHIIPAQAIQNRITVKIQRTDLYDREMPQPLDVSMVKNITDRLEILHLQTLYELLQASPRNSTADLFRAAEQLYVHEVRQRPTAEVTARAELAGFAMSIFKTDEIRARYDETLRQLSLQELLQDITESTRRSALKEVHPRQVLYYLQKAEEAGWPQEEALAKLKRHGRIHQWFIAIPPSGGEKPPAEVQQQEAPAQEEVRLHEGEKAHEEVRPDEDTEPHPVVSPPPPTADTSSPADTSPSPVFVRAKGKQVWRRTQAALLIFAQLVCLIALKRSNIDVGLPALVLLNWSNQIRLDLGAAMGNIQHALQAQLAFYIHIKIFNATVLNNGIAIFSFLLVALLISFCIALLLIPGLLFVFALIGLLSGTYLGLKHLTKTLLMAHKKFYQQMGYGADMPENARAWVVSKSYAFVLGWHMEKLAAERLAITSHQLRQLWLDRAQKVGGWKWVKNGLVVYVVNLLVLGCQLASLMQVVVAVELGAFCSSLYTLILLVWEAGIWVSVAWLRFVQAIYARLHQELFYCSKCRRNFDTPICVCPTCKREQAGLQPGINGVFLSTCKGCGTKLPTLYPSRQGRFVHLCPNCHHILK